MVHQYSLSLSLSLSLKPNENKVYIIDPTIRWESNDDVGSKVQAEKQAIYQSCYDNLAERYEGIQGRECEVIGLWIGARGSVSTQLVQFFDRFQLERKHLPTIAESVLIASVHMIHYHIYA